MSRNRTDFSFGLKMLVRRLGKLAGIVGTVVAFTAGPANGQTGTESATVTVRQTTSLGRVATLQQQLEKGLRVRRPSEFAFVRQVAQMVESRQLPLKLVQGSFDYARRRGRRRYPFPYFKRVMELRAAKIGVTITATTR